MGTTRTISALDIGTTKIGVIIAEVDDNNEINIVGVGTGPSDGLRRGVVVNLEKTVHSIERAVEEAERMAGVEIKSIYAGIAGDHIRSINSRGVIAVSRKDNEIGENDVRRVIEAAKAVAIPMDREIIHVIPQEFIVDDQDGIKDPVGMSGVRLEAEVHIVTGAVTSAKNVVRSIQRAGLKVEDLILQPIASSKAVLEDDEINLGVVLVDIGGGTTDVAIFHDGSIRHTVVIGLGGSNVTNDIAIGLRMPIDKAEQLKIQHGCALSSAVGPGEAVTVPGVGGRPPREISRHVLSSMIEPRMEEIFNLALRELKKQHFADLLGAGVVVTGGASSMEGVPELCERIFEMPARRGIPKGVGGLVDAVSDPRFSTAVGLVIHAVESGAPSGADGKGVLGRLGGGLGRWVKGLVS